MRVKHNPFRSAASTTALFLLSASFGLPSHASAGAHFHVVYAFTGNRDGGAPGYTLLRDRKGGFFGTATAGGRYGNGTVFQLQPTSGGVRLRTIYDFAADEGLPGWGQIGRASCRERV